MTEYGFCRFRRHECGLIELVNLLDLAEFGGYQLLNSIQVNMLMIFAFYCRSGFVDGGKSRIVEKILLRTAVDKWMIDGGECNTGAFMIWR